MRASPRLAKVGLILVFGALCIKSISLFFQILTDRRFFSGLTLSDGFVSLTSGLALLANVALVVSVIAAAAFFLPWFHAAYQNLADIEAAILAPQWALLGWVVPGLNLIRPPQIMGELTNQFSPGRRPKKARWTRQLWLWWAGGIVGISVHVILRLNLPNTRRGWFYWESIALLATLLLIVSVVACFGLVERAALKQEGIEASPPPLRPRGDRDRDRDGTEQEPRVPHGSMEHSVEHSVDG
ncbi:MAG: DUF4328 domain-containing protein [Actinomycetota bacterium]